MDPLLDAFGPLGLVGILLGAGGAAFFAIMRLRRVDMEIRRAEAAHQRLAERVGVAEGKTAEMRGELNTLKTISEERHSNLSDAVKALTDEVKGLRADFRERGNSPNAN